MDVAALFQGKHKFQPFTIPGTLNLAQWNPIPHRYRPGRRRYRPKHNLAYSHDDITSLQTSLNVLESVRAIRHHRWTVFDLQYPFLASIVLFSLYVAPSAPIIKTLAVIGGVLVLMMPATQQFFLPSLTIWTWLIYFFCSRYVACTSSPDMWTCPS
jgi:inositol phosphorylceramide synthase catalytic subunit